MIRCLDPVFKIDGKPMLSPDIDMEIEETDIDEDESGRDESKVMHRLVAREEVKTWTFKYKLLDRDDLKYIKGLFAGKPEFVFTYDVSDTGALLTVPAYSSKRTYKKHDNHKHNGLYKDMVFKIIQR